MTYRTAPHGGDCAGAEMSELQQTSVTRTHKRQEAKGTQTQLNPPSACFNRNSPPVGKKQGADCKKQDEKKLAAEQMQVVVSGVV